MAKASKKTKKAVEVTTPSIETYLPCEWVIQFDNDVPQIIKRKSEKKVKIPSAWRDAYSDSKFEVMTSEKYLDWIC